LIQLTSAGGAIVFDGGKAVAEKGTVELLNNGVQGTISLNNATISGDVVKIGALASNGQVLIRGGTISADTTLKLYAPRGNGSVRFLEDTTLGGNGAKLIVGHQVTIDNGKTVTIGGSQAASVYAQKPNYTGSGGNGSTTGTFGGKGANTFPKKDAPRLLAAPHLPCSAPSPKLRPSAALVRTGCSPASPKKRWRSFPRESRSSSISRTTSSSTKVTRRCALPVGTGSVKISKVGRGGQQETLALSSRGTSSVKWR
jgi:hypothetical protein